MFGLCIDIIFPTIFDPQHIPPFSTSEVDATSAMINHRNTNWIALECEQPVEPEQKDCRSSNNKGSGKQPNQMPNGSQVSEPNPTTHHGPMICFALHFERFAQSIDLIVSVL